MVNRVSVGIVSASGTGLQEVSTVVSNLGTGISLAIGVGGRDAGRQVGGIMFLEALRLLACDPATGVIVLISKPPDPDVTAAIAAEAAGAAQPVVTAFMGGRPGAAGPWAYCAATLEEAGIAASMLARGEGAAAIGSLLASRMAELDTAAAEARRGFLPCQRFVRGLFSGGTLCSEAAAVMAPHLGLVHGNVGGSSLADTWTSTGHTVLDLGADEFTVGRPHPMIDYSLRCRRIMQEAADPGVAVMLLDVVLGYGAHPDPAAELAPAIRATCAAAARQGRRLAVVCAVTGTERDPQCRSAVERALGDAGALVAPSNAAAAYLAATIVPGRPA
ncbi:MAG: hypothetical protein MUE60_12870 [Candidatus Eisenbacteria bacterium]|nr:hypothetical protein [Candidatus Eisenbacteria bacterium]